MTEAVISTDLDFRIQSWNQAAERIYGWRAEEVLGRVTLDFLRNPSGSQTVRDQAVTAIAEQGTWSGDVVRLRKDGSEIHLLLTVTKLTDENGLPFGIVAISRDITKRKQTVAALQAKIAEEHEVQTNASQLSKLFCLKLIFGCLENRTRLLEKGEDFSPPFPIQRAIA